MLKLWLLIASAAFFVSRPVHGQSGLSYSVQVLKSCKSGQCIAGSNGVVSLSVTTGELGSTPCAVQTKLPLCPGQPLFQIGSYMTYTLILLDSKANAPPNYKFTVPLTCKDGDISGTVNTKISGFYKVEVVAFYNGQNPARPGLLENVGCLNQPKELDAMIVQIMPGSHFFLILFVAKY